MRLRTPSPDVHTVDRGVYTQYRGRECSNQTRSTSDRSSRSVPERGRYHHWPHGHDGYRTVSDRNGTTYLVDVATQSHLRAHRSPTARNTPATCVTRRTVLQQLGELTDAQRRETTTVDALVSALGADKQTLTEYIDALVARVLTPFVSVQRLSRRLPELVEERGGRYNSPRM